VRTEKEQTGLTERDEDRFVAQLLAQILDGEGALPERMILLRQESAELSDRQRTQRMLRESGSPKAFAMSTLRIPRSSSSAKI
jgi:hypothetical protein